MLEQLRYIKKASVTPGAARQLLERPDASAVALVIAVQQLAAEAHEWEPETLWLTLDRMRIDVPVANRAKLLAAFSLLYAPAFYWDAIVFEKTALAFDSVEPNADALQEATSAQLAWAVKEAAWIVAQHGDPEVKFEHEPSAYTAVVLHREGLLLAPKQLSFAQELLDGMNVSRPDLRSVVEEKWKRLDKEYLESRAFAQDAADVQLARLAAVELHVRAREAQVAADLASLR